MKKAKQTSIIVLAFLMIISLSIAITLAFLTDRTDRKKNTFTIGNGVKVQLEEPLYDKNTKGYQYSPEEILDKDPTIVIPEDAMEQEYIATVVEYYVDYNGDGIYEEEISYDEFKQYASIGSIIDGTLQYDQPRKGWFSVDNNKTFFYGTGENGVLKSLTPVSKDSKIVLFDKVKINKDVPKYKNDTEIYVKEQPVAFRIDVIAYAVQGDIEDQKAIKALNDIYNLDIGEMQISKVNRKVIFLKKEENIIYIENERRCSL